MSEDLQRSWQRAGHADRSFHAVAEEGCQPTVPHETPALPMPLQWSSWEDSHAGSCAWPVGMHTSKDSQYLHVTEEAYTSWQKDIHQPQAAMYTSPALTYDPCPLEGSTQNGEIPSYADAEISGTQSSEQLSHYDVNNPTIEEMRDFAHRFKDIRTSLGFTQVDVGLALGKRCGRVFSQTTICRFEVLQLSLHSMYKLKPLLEDWISSVDGNQLRSGVRRKRTDFTRSAKRALEQFFNKQRNPSVNEILQLSNSLRLEKKVVRSWFCNRRQREKKMMASFFWNV